MLLTPELKARFRELGEQDTSNPIIPTRFCAEWVNHCWYPISYNEQKECFFGIVQGLEIKLDYFSHIDLSIIRGPYGVRITRDDDWKETDLNHLRLKIYHNL